MAFRCLIDLGAYVLAKDADGSNVIELAALHFHTNILEFIIDWENPALPVWTTLVGKCCVNYTSWYVLLISDVSYEKFMYSTALALATLCVYNVYAHLFAFQE